MKKIWSFLLAVLMMAGAAAPMFSQTAEASMIVDAAKEIEGAVAYNGSSYKVYTEPMTWTEAKEYCEALGGHLVCITSQEEQDFINGLVAYSEKNCCWIGGYREGESWEWVTGEKFEYTNWAEIEPSNENGNETRIHLFGKERTGGKGEKSVGQWNDCSEDGAEYSDEFYALSNYGFICEWENYIDSEKFTALDLNSSYTAEINCDADTVVVNSVNDEKVFTVCIQDAEGRTAKFTGKNLEGNTVEITQSEEGITVESAAAGAEIDCEYENMKKSQIDSNEPFSFSLRKVLLTAGWVLAGAIVGGGTTAVIVFIKLKRKKAAAG